MKGEQIRVNAARAKAMPGGDWQELDLVGQGRVQILPAGRDATDQALAVYTELKRMMALGLDPRTTAVIARQWKFLDPLRAALEAGGVPVVMADEQAPPLWRLREAQALLGYLEDRQRALGSRLIRSDDIQPWLAEQGGSGWWPMLAEAIGEFAEDTQGAEVSLSILRDWLAEWGHANRTKQHGVLLLTAHRAKGLEFDHVFVLDGEWRAGRTEDKDAVRRLYYVSMTRARATLTLVRMGLVNEIVDGLGDHPALFRRPSASWLPAPGPMSYRYFRLGLKDIDLGYAGRQTSGSAVHRAITALRVGDPLRYVADDKGVRLESRSGVTVGRLSRRFVPPAGLSCTEARVRGLMFWRKCDSSPEYPAHCRLDAWEVVLPELVFAP
ncbi:MAG: ATP-binding domain-containing protein [Steroidobacteraceae bacterium]